MCVVPSFVGMSLLEAFKAAGEACVVLVRSVSRDFPRGWGDGVTVAFQSVEAGAKVSKAMVVKITPSQ